MGLGGEAVWALSVMWALVAIVFAFLLLRLYTRIVCLAAYGVDDHIYLAAFILLVIYTAFTHVSGNYGFGQTPAEIGDMEKIVKATLYECIGQGFGIAGMPVAKAALGAFLLRLVTKTWHRVSIWAIMILAGIASLAQILCFWLACRPLAYVYDRRIPGGYCPIDTRPTSYLLCVSLVIADVFFALFPWVMVWDLQMPRREKLTIAGSFSLGLIAAAAGIKRTTEVEGLFTADYLRDSVGLIVWSCAELSITLICIGIPVCRPLYSRIFKSLQSTTSRSTGGYQKHGASDDKNHHTGDSAVALRTIGGGVMDAGDGAKHYTPQMLRAAEQKSGSHHGKSGADSDSDLSVTEMNLGINGPFTKTRVGAGRNSDSKSDEQILGDGYREDNLVRQAEYGKRASGKQGQITVTESVRVDRS
ncbi:hypothetical protein LIA77_04085 [Sarocladium implicatum]|nr:hypothetical protein LIA77_04085 [Sarocladium implicatum]